MMEEPLKLAPSSLATGALKLEATAGGTKVKVWETASKGTEVVLPKTWTVGTDTIPTTLYLEGVALSASERDVSVKLTYTHGTLSCSDTITATVVGVDLDIDNVADADEETKGGFLCLNKDDDNKNKIKDKDESGNVAGENDLIELNLKLFPNTLTTGSIELEAIAGGANVKVWKTANKGTGNEIPLPATWVANSNTMPSSVYLEGVKTSSAIRDVELKLKYTKDSLSCDDTVKATVIEIEKVEVHPSDTDTHKIPANTGAVHDDHFVCARDTGDIVIDAKILPSEVAEITDLITWDAGGDTITSPAVGTDKTTAKLLSDTSKKMTVKLKVKSMDYWEGLVWVVWSTGSVVQNGSTLFVRQSDTTIDGTATNSAVWAILSNKPWVFKFTITPSEIIVDNDRPDLAGAKKSASGPPGGVSEFSGQPLSGGAVNKWDVSRRVQYRIINPNLIPRGKFSSGFGTIYNTQPLADSIAVAFPLNGVVGNDDSGVNDENNDPYNIASGLLAHAVGEVTSRDAPTFFIPEAGASNLYTYEEHNLFGEFLRVELDGTWYRASDFLEWNHKIKIKFENNKWVNDGSSSGTGN